MSAREELFEAMTGGGWSLAPGEAESANRLIDAFAHELAEQQRKRVRALAANPLRYGSAHPVDRRVPRPSGLGVNPVSRVAGQR